MLLDNYVYSDGFLKTIILQSFGMIEALFSEKYPSNYGDIYTNITNAVWSLFLTQWSIHSGLFEFEIYVFVVCGIIKNPKKYESSTMYDGRIFQNIADYSWENENFLIQN